jgi:hypothetical protein
MGQRDPDQEAEEAGAEEGSELGSLEINFCMTNGDVDTVLFEADDDILDRLLWWVHAIGIKAV